MSVDVSVVVPVYNSEQFLRQCVDSLLAQTLKNVEFIFVDDGSTDHSVEILQAYKQKDSRISILRQQNQYAGVARNNGMKVATGKYLLFLDSDDFFEPTMLEESFNCAEENQAEIVVFGYYYFDHLTHITTEREFRVDQGKAVTLQQFGVDCFRFYDAIPWNKLFLRSFVIESQVEFQAIRKFNDNYFVYTSGFTANRIVYYNKRFVYYRINNSSSLQGTGGKDKELFIFPLLAVKHELQKKGLYSETIKRAFNAQFSYLIKYYSKIGPMNLDNERKYYDTIKRNLVPVIFDSQEEFKDEKLIWDLYVSDSFEEFLLMQLGEEREKTTRMWTDLKKTYEMLENTVSKRSYDYRIGHIIMFLPRAFMKALYGLKKAMMKTKAK